MSLIHDCNELAKSVAHLAFKADKQQNLYFNVISGIVAIAQKHRLDKNYAVSDEIRAMLKANGVRIIQGTAQYQSYDDIPEKLRNTQVNDSWVIEDS